MRYLIVSLFCYLARLLFHVRYRIKITGKKHLEKKRFNKKAGILFLPNHPALVDPIFLFAFLWPKFQLRPLVIEYIYRQKGISFFMKIAKALSVPDLDTSMNEIKVLKTEKVMKQIISGLKKGENYLLYPSGRLKHAGKEVLGGSSAVHTLLQKVPDVNIVLVRISGLWGSSFSRAYTSTSPNFAKVFFRNVKHLLRALLFFLPKRRVLIELEQAGREFPGQEARLQVNRYLENWYNRYPEDCKDPDSERTETEPLKKVSYRFYKKKYLKPFVPKQEKFYEDKAAYSPEAEKAVFQQIRQIHPEAEVSLQMHLARDLGFDSLEIAELITFLSGHFQVKNLHPEDVQTVKDAVMLASGVRKRKQKKGPQTDYSWPEEKDRGKPQLEGRTIFEAFLKAADRLDKYPAAGDDLIGVVSYKKLKTAALALALEIRKMPGKYIGVMLPASIGADAVVLAIMLAGKIPVMMNWTLGKRFLNHMMEITKARKVISSWRFLERLSGIEFGSLTDKLILVEDIKYGMGLKTKLQAFYYSQKNAQSLLRALHLEHVREKDAAVVLFTSGTEANPKGVPLSHKNIIFDLQGCIKSVKINAKDIMLGILPPFHSFGFTIVGLFPLMYGVRVAYYPDPTDSYGVAESIGRWKTTIMCSAPSFLKGILNAASQAQLRNMRLFVSGAEKTPEEFFQKIQRLGSKKELLEGYGITECSPVIAIDRPKEKHRGVGRLIPGVQALTLHPETKKILPAGSEGELCFAGDNIFYGYLDEEKNPFFSYAGKKWYKSGDLGYLDEEGFLILSGRLKRFIKIGGEMISLGAVEAVLNKFLEKENTALPEDEAALAVIADEARKDRPELYLFTILQLDRMKLNRALKNAGFSSLIKISQVKNIDQIPVLSTGKIDYRTLQSKVG